MLPYYALLFSIDGYADYCAIDVFAAAAAAAITLIFAFIAIFAMPYAISASDIFAITPAPLPLFADIVFIFHATLSLFSPLPRHFRIIIFIRHYFIFDIIATFCWLSIHCRFHFRHSLRRRRFSPLPLCQLRGFYAVILRAIRALRRASAMPFA